ncbi:MAG: sulfurase [Pseudomonadota bacterium]
MSILKKTNIVGEVDAVLINNDASVDLTSGRVDQATVTYGGFVGDAHFGLTRESCVRVAQQYNEGTEIRNVRQISILSVEEMQGIAETMEIPELKPEWVGANLSIWGIPKLTELPPSARLIFDGGASLVVDMENGPCKYPGDIVEKFHPGHGRRFTAAAMGRRGITAWVEREGIIKNGAKVTLHIPPQRLYEV